MLRKTATLAVKAGAGLARGGVAIAGAEAEELWPFTEVGESRRCAFQVPLPTGEVVDVDVYEGSLDGIVTAEVEFPTADAAAALHGARVVRA